MNMYDVLSILFPGTDLPEDLGDDRNRRFNCPLCDGHRTAQINYGVGRFGVVNCHHRGCAFTGNPVNVVKETLSLTTAEAYDWIRSVTRVRVKPRLVSPDIPEALVMILKVQMVPPPPPPRPCHTFTPGQDHRDAVKKWRKWNSSVGVPL